MRCTKCNVEVPSSYMKCPNCGQGFHGINTPSSFDKPSQAPYQPFANQANPNSQNSSSLIQVAKISSRFFAIVIDTLIILVPLFLIGMLIGFWGSMTDESDMLTSLKAQFVGAFLGILYEAVFLSGPWQATPGKRLLGIKVTDQSGMPISFWRAFGRSAAKLLSSIFLIGYIMAFFTKNKRALHDLMAGTIVIEGK